MGQWLEIARSLKFVSDEELKSLLAEVDSINSYSVNDRGPITHTNDINTFEAFHNASITQADILLERFPEILDDLGYYYAFYGRIELVDYLLAKGCNDTRIALGLIFGLRELEQRSLKNNIDSDPRSTNYNNKYSNFNEAKSEEMYQLKLAALKKLFEKSADKINKDVIYNEIIKKIYFNVFFAHEDDAIKQMKIFYQSGQAKAFQEIFSMLFPDKSLREALIKEALEIKTSDGTKSYVIKHNLKDLSEVYLGMKLKWIDEVHEQQLLNKILDQVLLSTNALELVAHQPHEELTSVCDAGDLSLNNGADIYVDQLPNMGEASQQMHVDALSS
jgi:hypothetical protein